MGSNVWDHSGDVRVSQDATNWYGKKRRLSHLGLEVVRNAAEGVRGDRRASFGCSRAGRLDAKDVQRLQAERHSLRQLAACAAVQAPQQEAIHLLALPCAQAGRTCMRPHCCEGQSCMDVTQSAQIPALLCRPHSAKPSSALPCRALKLAAPTGALDAVRGKALRMPRRLHRPRRCPHTRCSSSWQRAAWAAAEAPHCGGICRFAPLASQALVTCPHAHARKGQEPDSLLLRSNIPSSGVWGNPLGIALPSLAGVLDSADRSQPAQTSGWLTSPAGRLDDQGVDVRRCGRPRHVPGGRACQGGGVQVGSHVRHISVESRQVPAPQPRPQLVAQPGVVIAQLLHFLQRFRVQGDWKELGGMDEVRRLEW